MADLQQYLPTKKWWAALGAGVATIVASALVSGDLGGTETSAFKVLLVALAGAWLKRNDKTASRDGVPA